MPAHLKPAAVTGSSPAGAAQVDGSLLALVTNWRLVVADMAKEYGVDLFDPIVLARPWPGVRTMIFSLLDSPTRLREALTRR
ncbi:hypothetical protein [Microbacterium sp. Yaish 1]|uniref:hypothetical protein n=1 Tax=Microbacterium sp. Yaish 1 TaxID=2025014 RepID=UPI000B93EA71|nr:hypothetical protein [Microbacterium sp. Yaish 1]OYC97207.1 hypothetical protein CI089_01240 [Microbacterium sp. Yaish 1]